MSGGIQDFYANKTILITGATGFLGSYLVEKLLRSCTDIKKIYLLIRPKSQKTSYDRLFEFLDNPVYMDIKENNPIVLKKLEVLAGDLEMPELGLSDKDLEKIKRGVNCVFHLGATVKFTEELRRAILINIHGTNSLIKISKQIENLESFVYVSTAYSQCLNDVTQEVFYSCKENSDTLINMANTIDNEKLNEMTPIILGKWYNTYVFTKHISEDLIRKNKENMPIVIFRPSAISPPYKEPKLRWTSSFEAISLFFIALNLGLIHTLCCNPNDKFDVVPADLVVNGVIAAGWSIGSRKLKRPSPEIFNYVSCQQNPITWKRQEMLLMESDAIMPSNRKVFHRNVLYSTNRIVLWMVDLLFMPWLYLINLKNVLYGKPSSSLKFYNKGKKYSKAIEPFTSREWNFEDHNTKLLWSTLTKEDKEIFNFDIKSIDWKEYYHNFSYGLRYYILKDTSPVEHCLRKANLLKVIFYIFVVFYTFILLFVVYKCIDIII